MLMPSHCCGMCQADHNFISSTISNTSSPLLRLPQELKDRIYQFVYGGFYVRVSNDNSSVDPNTEFRMAAYEDAYFEGLGICCYGKRKGNGLPVASLGTCRQLYHEAKNVLYSANDFMLLSDSRLLGLFIRRLDDGSHRSLAVRSLHLGLVVSNINEERKWDNAFRTLAESLKNLRHISIYIFEVIWDASGYYYSRNRRHSPAHGKRPFLRSLLELKELPLKTFELGVMESHGATAGDTKYVWTTAQKREWAQKMKGAILGSG